MVTSLMPNSGTWFENTYAGLKCDIPAHTYQLSQSK